MLRDLGLRTEEEIKEHNDSLKERDPDKYYGCMSSPIKKQEQLLNDQNKEIPEYYKDKEYRDLLEKCHSICNRIYINRNISLNEAEIIKCLNEIDELLRDKEVHS